jgi:DNA-binding transcriptional LysR family regulator
MDIASVDLNLLVVFEAMMAHRSVTRAGQALSLSQPAMSAALGRLRELLGDPLFARSGAEMKPTARALALAEPIRRVLDIVRVDVLHRAAFDPATTTRTFALLMPDIGEVNFVPRLVERLAREAPGARLKTVAQPHTAAAQALESGAADLAIGYFPDLQRAGFYQQKLFDNPHVCLLRSGHPLKGRRVALKDFLAAAHASVRPDGREHAFDQFMAQRGLRRTVAVELAHFMSLLPLLERSDLVATVPRDIATVCVRYGTLRMAEPPVKPPAIAIHQFWHTLAHKDAANIWLRGVMRSLFATPTA